MKIFRINATQGNISFKKSIKADSYQDARNKFMLDSNKNNRSFPFVEPNTEIEEITRRY